MDNSTYILEVLRRCKPESVNHLHAILGIGTEAGELLSTLKKTAIYEKPIDEENIKEEIGDLLWYVALLIHVTGTSFEEIMEANTVKLRARYPEGYSNEAALARIDKLVTGETTKD